MIYKTRAGNLKIQYSTWGNLKSNHVTLFFHGFPGSHLQAQFLEQYFAKRGFGLIATDRPGYGGSDLCTPRDYKTYAEGLLEILDHHGVRKFSVLGVSGGAPMAHLISSYASDRVEKLAVVCGLASFAPQSLAHFNDFQRRGLRIANLLPSIVLLTTANTITRFYNPQKKLEHFVQFLNKPDQEVLLAPEHRDLLMTSMTHARAQKSKGIVWDTKLYSTDWFAKNCVIENLKKFPVHYFHGKEDRLLNYGMSEYMHSQVPHSKLQLFEKEGHYSLPFRKADEILGSLV